MHTLSPYSAENIKVKMEEESRNNTFRDGILGLLTYTNKMFLSENVPQIRNININSQILYHLSHSLTLKKKKTPFWALPERVAVLKWGEHFLAGKYEHAIV
jgi:hypothetical protein